MRADGLAPIPLKKPGREKRRHSGRRMSAGSARARPAILRALNLSGRQSILRLGRQRAVYLEHSQSAPMDTVVRTAAITTGTAGYVGGVDLLITGYQQDAGKNWVAELECGQWSEPEAQPAVDSDARNALMAATSTGDAMLVPANGAKESDLSVTPALSRPSSIGSAAKRPHCSDPGRAEPDMGQSRTGRRSEVSRSSRCTPGARDRGIRFEANAHRECQPCSSCLHPTPLARSLDNLIPALERPRPPRQSA